MEQEIDRWIRVAIHSDADTLSVHGEERAEPQVEACDLSSALEIGWEFRRPRGTQSRAAGLLWQ